jgi:hypothetical protein
VSTVKAGLPLMPELRIGDNGFPMGRGEVSILMLSEDSRVSTDTSGVDGDGPVTQDIRTSPNGPVLQFVPGALLDLS